MSDLTKLSDLPESDSPLAGGLKTDIYDRHLKIPTFTTRGCKFGHFGHLRLWITFTEYSQKTHRKLQLWITFTGNSKFGHLRQPLYASAMHKKSLINKGFLTIPSKTLIP